MPEFETVRVDGTFAEEMEREVNNMLDALFEATDSEDMDLDDFPETPSGAPFCGCQTCVVREVMVMTTELTARGVREGLIEQIGNGS